MIEEDEVRAGALVSNQQGMGGGDGGRMGV